MAQNELRRRREQLEKLNQMAGRAHEDEDEPRLARLVASIGETEARIAELEQERTHDESGETRRRRR